MSVWCRPACHRNAPWPSRCALKRSPNVTPMRQNHRVARERTSAETIWLELDGALRRQFAGYADPSIVLPLPTKLDKPDASGCNWTIQTPPSHEFAAQIEAALSKVKARWNLE